MSKKNFHPRTTINWSAADWSESSRAIAAALGCCVDMVNRKRRVAAPGTGKKRVDWGQPVDWSLPNHVIAEKLGTYPANVATVRSVRNERSPATRKPGSGLWKQKKAREGKA